MKFRWCGHACFLITFEDGTKVVTDPFGDIGYPALDVDADVVTVSHDHFDHNEVSAVKGDPVVLDKPGGHQTHGLKAKGIPVYHDDSKGSQRGENVIFVMEKDEKRIAHLGDLGHDLTEKEFSDMGRVDVLLTPVGGHFTIDADQAKTIIEKLDPKVVIPMHYKTEAIDFPIAGVDNFLKHYPNYEKAQSSVVKIKAEDLQGERRIIVLDYE